MNTYPSVRRLGRTWPAVLPLLAGVLSLAGCNASLDVKPDADIAPDHLFMFAPITTPATPTGLQAQRVDLGRRLFYDTTLSENNTVSCNSCHLLNRYGVDHQPTSLGHDNRLGFRNSPTVYNAALEFVQFWDGHAKDLPSQAVGPMMNPVEMGMSGPAQVVAHVRANPAYVHDLHAAFPNAADPVSMDTITQSITAFEKGLLTPSRWDQYLQGDTTALTADEKQGLQLFLRTGCASCHAGKDMGGNSYQQLGAANEWRGNQVDRGRLQATLESRDAMFFKVPTLRNVDQTAPYFHDGHVPTLEEAVRLMGREQADTELSDAEIHSIVTFLHALTGPIPTQYIQPPATTSVAAKDKSIASRGGNHRVSALGAV
ncbi:MAG TPA: cytochrome c peroxidase [Granulicella sp.]|nr:cytochrome c peroxidase [Granulicella sp.]